MTSSRWLVALVLISSLGINLFLAGILLGRHFVGPPPRNPEIMLGRMVDRLSASLNPSDRTVVQRAFEAHRRDFADHFAALGHARLAIGRAMSAEPFDREALRMAFDNLDAQRAALAGVFRAVLLEVASDISPQGRQSLARQDPLRP